MIIIRALFAICAIAALAQIYFELRSGVVGAKNRRSTREVEPFWYWSLMGMHGLIALIMGGAAAGLWR
ncbi:MAG TPA: hypothetical protein VM689_26585 [Aliidongia sp.]|nr:hypothetical protein [Aliidongia sp.]